MMSRNFLERRRSSAVPDQKSNVAQTCNLLSQYVKENGSSLMKELNLGINGKLEPSGTHAETSAATTAMVPSSKEVCKSGSAQLTIFYGGQVLVFDDFSAAKAEQVMQLATKGTTSSNTSTTTAAFVSSPSSDNYGNSIPYGSNILSNSGSIIQAEKETIVTSQPTMASDLPIARRASLHRFLEKRKDRASARAPYQLYNRSAESPREHMFDLNL